MSNNISIPNPQHRYLEPFKNRVFQYDTKHSNLFLSQYANGILNAVGNDTVVRGLVVTAEIDAYATGLIFNVSKGSLIQDTTYIELPTSTSIHISDIVPYHEQLVIVYTNWRYLQTVYENPLKFEVTLYNKDTRKTITAWSTTTNRVILGIFKFKVENGIIINVDETKLETDLVFEDSNVVQNGTFDEAGTLFWTAINSTLKVIPNDGTSGTPYCEVQPIADKFQGIAQVISTKINYNYRLLVRLRSKVLIPFSIILRNGDSIFKLDAVEVGRLENYTQTGWVEYSIDFIAISNKTIILILKEGTDLNQTFDIDSVFALEFTENRKQTDINNIKFVDGGILP